ncbi:MAG TPA: molybdopterin-synthase adenylyltransferase MoeB [Thermoplasmata archaeon]|nr:molybdopterin-synthase adenylyltransferase MoeB [Thermoplasmata archaeon]
MTPTRVKIPRPLQSFAGGATEVSVEGATVGEVIRHLADEHPGLEKHLFASSGELRSFVTLYVNDEDVRYLQRARTPIHEGDTVTIVPAIAGGTSGAPTAPKEPPLGRDQLVRYSRHLLLPEVGVIGQKKLLSSKVVIVGAGGLGSPSALYLAAAGVGEIGLVDFDTVDASNLQRQVLYATRDVGRPKLDAAKERLESLNPGVRVTRHAERLGSGNVLEVLRPYDVIIDGTDNFPTRYLVNDAAVLLGKPNVYGSIYRFEGQASVFDARRGPCYRCLYPEPPPPDQVPSCAEAGVLGILPGMIGTLQATEAVKLILGIGEPLIGRLLLFDALEMRFRELTIRKNPTCVMCSPSATQHGLIDYDQFCGVPQSDSAAGGIGIPEITPEALRDELGSADPPLLLDVREPGEWEVVHLPNATLIPRGELPDRVTEIARARAVVVYCRSGQRSSQATRLLLELGFQNVRNLKGGLLAWSERVDPSMPRV